jgi:hypothetical protein
LRLRLVNTRVIHDAVYPPDGAKLRIHRFFRACSRSEEACTERAKASVRLPTYARAQHHSSAVSNK